MLMPSIFGENLFDDFFNDFPFYDYDKEMKNTEKKLYGRKASHVMKTDIRELDKSYSLLMMPCISCRVRFPVMAMMVNSFFS